MNKPKQPAKPPLHNRILSVLEHERSEAMKTARQHTKYRTPEVMEMGGRFYQAEFVEMHYRVKEAEIKDIIAKCQAEVSQEPAESLETAKYGPKVAYIVSLVQDNFSGVLKGLGKEIAPLDGAIIILEDVAEKMGGEKDQGKE